MQLDREAIEQSIRNAEEAIASRGFDDVFKRFRNAYMNSTGGIPIVQSEDVLLIKRGLMSSSFIAAYYHLQGNKANRDKAANSCAIMLSALDGDPTELFQEHIRCEQLWLLTFKREGIMPPPPIGCYVMSAGLVVLFVAGIAYWFMS